MNHMSSSKITVIIPNHNHGHLIEDCINALKEQDFLDFKALIIDDQSTDDSVDVISKIIENDPRFSLQVLEKRCGVVELQNLAISGIESEFILLAAADDYILPGFFTFLLSILENNPDIAFATSKCLIPVERNSFLSRPIFHEEVCSRVFSKEEAAQQLLNTDFLYVTGASLIRTRAFKSLGVLEQSLGSLADGVHLRMLAAMYGYAFINQYGLVWRRSDNGLSVSDLQDEKHLSAKLNAARAIFEKCSEIDIRYGQKYVRRLSFVSKIYQSKEYSLKEDIYSCKYALASLIKPILYLLRYLKFRPFGIWHLPRLVRSQRRLSYSTVGVVTSVRRPFND